jgi:D-xylose 1-dehydrogenase (NADP+, D-xylono-1,5-lactone-forming)
MTEGTLRWGLLSTARINQRVIPALRAADRSQLAAVASRDGRRAEAYAAEWDIPQAFPSYEALLAAPDIDAVYVALPNKLHAEWTVRAALAGKHVLCEKPLALNVAECDQIIAAAQTAGVVVLEAVMYLYHPLLHRARAMIREGVVGQVTLVRSSFSFNLDRPADVRWQPALGGGCLWDVGSYPVSFIRWIAGEPEEVFGWQWLGESGVDVTFAGLLRCADGVLGLFDSGFRQPFRTEAEVVGTEGHLVIENPYLPGSGRRILLRRQGEQETITLPEIDAYRCEVEALAGAVLDGAAPPVPLSSSRANVATLVALYEAAKLGRPVAPSGPAMPSPAS